MPDGTIHLGVYGIYRSGDILLMIKKVRGPYAGLYDLPGGKIEFNESIASCLKREVREETGAEVRTMEFFTVNDYRCRYEKEGKARQSHHIGLYYRVDLAIKRLKTSPDGKDSGGAVFVPISMITERNTAPIVFPVIADYLKEYGEKSAS